MTRLTTVVLAVLAAVPLGGMGAIFSAASADATITIHTGPGIAVTRGIATGPDGAVWFTNLSPASIGRITTTGTVTDFTDPGIAQPEEITAGPDGALWFIDSENSIGRITTAGVVTKFTDPGIGGALAITAGPDGALWFTNGFQHTRSVE